MDAAARLDVERPEHWGPARLPTRRRVMRGVAAVGVSCFAGASYAFGIEPHFRLETVRYQVALPGWDGPPMRIAALADLHACEPWMPAERVRAIAAHANALKPDVIVLLGDYVSSLHRFGESAVPAMEWGRALSVLQAPLGVFAVLGNHDFWERPGPAPVRAALRAAGAKLFENEAVALTHEGQRFWLAGTGSALAYPLGRGRFRGTDDLPGTLAQVRGQAPLILLAHEPDQFHGTPDRVALTLSGHTHGGQVRIPGVGAPFVPSRYGERYAYGHVVEGARQLVVSGGLGCSGLPVRFGVPPEITVIEVAGIETTGA
jgi:predicted MPP superfamily phosphohydrolase